MSSTVDNRCCEFKLREKTSVVGHCRRGVVVVGIIALNPIDPQNFLIVYF
jgi:hypothetical protein